MDSEKKDTKKLQSKIDDIIKKSNTQKKILKKLLYQLSKHKEESDKDVKGIND